MPIVTKEASGPRVRISQGHLMANAGIMTGKVNRTFTISNKEERTRTWKLISRSCVTTLTHRAS